MCRPQVQCHNAARNVTYHQHRLELLQSKNVLMLGKHFYYGTLGQLPLKLLFSDHVSKLLPSSSKYHALSQLQVEKIKIM